ncbi:DUF6046 domain-containing protein [Flavobacterium sp. LB3P45]|uniref:DUF6046 domain-containing protein n=1 Tax=Flavobacterium fructosi TaxID=3230416 RepID=A0ABW6HPY1_9FLAO
MDLTNKDIIFASLMGSNSVATYQRTQLVQDELSKHVLPKIPFLPLHNEEQIDYTAVNPSFRLNQADAPTPEEQQFFPLSFSFTEGGQKWLFPYEPMINIGSGNNIVKRNVAKQGDKLIGTIKERWSRKDFEFSVTGVLIGSLLKGSVADCFPKKQMESLFEFLKYNKEFYIYCAPLEIMGVTKVVVDDYSFPFTKGENVQAYDLKLCSDFSYNLLIKEEF